MKDNWISVKDRPLYEQDKNKNWTCTKDGDGHFIAAIPYESKNKPGQLLWWIHHCVVEDEIGLCIVGDDTNEPAGYSLEDVTHWQPSPEQPKTEER